VAITLPPACTSPSADPPPQLVTATRPIGTWQGEGNRTIGDVLIDSGRFRINWHTQAGRAPGSGTFRLTVRSSVSGRPLQVIADHHGTGNGSVDFEEDRRSFDFTVDSANVEWSFTVEELVAVDAKAPAGSDGR
jgi:hypothetical protein